MKKTIIIAVIAAVAGIALSMLFTKTPSPGLAPVQSVAKQKQQLEQVEKQYEAHARPLIQQVSTLIQKSISVKTATLKAESVATADKEKLSERIATEGTDTLKQLYQAYAINRNVSDSLKDLQVALLDSTVNSQDTLLQLERSNSTSLKSLLDTAWRQQEILTVNQAVLQKELKKVKRKKTFLNIALFALAGAATTILITR